MTFDIATKTITNTPVAVDRNAMKELFTGLGRKPKLPRLQPPERIRGNAFGEKGVNYTIMDRKGMANIVNHAEMKVLHELLAEIEGKAAEVNPTTDAAVQSSTN
jgi:hypothetical protein